MSGANFSIDANVTIKVKDLKGQTLQIVHAKNRLVDFGRQAIRDLLGGTGFRPDNIRIGSGGAATMPSMIGLVAELARLDIDRRIQRTFGVEFQVLVDSNTANGSTIAEVGTFEGEILFARAVLAPAIQKTSLIQLTISHTFTVNDA